jgi:hypothetical protein
MQLGKARQTGKYSERFVFLFAPLFPAFAIEEAHNIWAKQLRLRNRISKIQV